MIGPLRTAALGILLLSGGCAGSCGCEPAAPELPWVSGEGPTTALAVDVFPDADHVFTHPSLPGYALGQKAGGALVLAIPKGERWELEAFSSASVPGTAVMTLNEATNQPVAAWLAPASPDEAPPVSAPLLAPPDPVPGEGTLRLSRRRSLETWRERVLAARALHPALAVDGEGVVHLAFLQPEGEGFTLVYLQVERSGLGREEVSRIAEARRLSLTLAEGRPVIAWVDDAGRAVVAQQAEEGGAFEARALPLEVLGRPAAPATALDVSTEGGLHLAAVRPVQGRVLQVGEGETILPQAAAGGANALFLVELSGPEPQPSLVAVGPAGPSQVRLAGPDRVAAILGGVALVAERGAGGWAVESPIEGSVDALSLTSGGAWFARRRGEAFELRRIGWRAAP